MQNQPHNTASFGYPFGMLLPERTWTSDSASYRYGFNTQERDDEIYGEGNSTTAEYWQYDSRLGRRWNIDPKSNLSVSVYACFVNNPIAFTDKHGDTILISWHSNEQGSSIDIVNENLIFEQINDGVFIISAHGNPTELVDNSTGAYKRLSNPLDIYNKLLENESFKKAIENGLEIVIILKSCNTGTYLNEMYSTFAGEDLKSIAQLMSESVEFKDMKIIAPNGFVGNQIYETAKIITSIELTITKPNSNSLNDGGWRTFKGGQQIHYESSRDSDLNRKKPVNNKASESKSVDNKHKKSQKKVTTKNNDKK